jgi:hypothetical protein
MFGDRCKYEVGRHVDPRVCGGQRAFLSDCFKVKGIYKDKYIYCRLCSSLTNKPSYFHITVPSASNPSILTVTQYHSVKMRTSTIASLLAIAATTTAQFLNQTAPFALVVYSQNETYNGTSLVACHEGAAIEGLCIGAEFSYPIPTSVETFTQNYSSSLTVEPTVGVVGYLTYELRGGNFNLSSPMELSYNPTSNVAVPLFTPADSGLEISFLDDKLGVPSYLNDQVTPPAYSDTAYFDRWYICETNAGYDYITLALVLGDTAPQNPSCVEACIKRVFI